LDRIAAQAGNGARTIADAVGQENGTPARNLSAIAASANQPHPANHAKAASTVREPVARRKTCRTARPEAQIAAMVSANVIAGGR
jgi:hypothetical protein